MSRFLSIFGPTIVFYWVLYMFWNIVRALGKYHGIDKVTARMSSELGLGKTKERYRDTLRIWIK